MRRLALVTLILMVLWALGGCGNKVVSQPVDLTGNPESARGSGWAWAGGVSRTLTLSDLNMAVEGSYGFLLPAGASVVSAGGSVNTITVTAAADESQVCGILCQGALYLRGSGSLSVQAGAAGICSAAIMAETGDVLQDNMALSLKASPAQAESLGLCVRKGRYQLRNGTLQASGDAAGVSAGLYVAGDVFLSGGTVNLEGGAAQELSTGLFAPEGAVALKGNTTALAGGQNEGIRCRLLSAELSTLESFGDEMGIWALEGITVTSGRLEARGSQAALWVEKEDGILTLGRGVQVESPTDAALSIGPEAGRTFRLLQGEGEIATQITLYKKP